MINDYIKLSKRFTALRMHILKDVTIITLLKYIRMLGKVNSKHTTQGKKVDHIIQKINSFAVIIR